MTNIKQGDKAKSTGNKSNYASELARKTYAQGSVLKTVFKITFPVFILMIINSLYQMVDTIMSAQLVDYASGTPFSGSFTGSLVMQYISPLIMLAMALTILVNIGYGTSFSQKMGAGDIEGAKRSTSTALWMTLVFCIMAIAISVLLGASFIKWNMPESLFDIPAGDSSIGQRIYIDAQQTCIIYTIAIAFSGFQGIISRQLRAEGHIKSMSYLPLVSIPFNIALDYLFMGVMGMYAVGAALATLIAMSITLILTYGYSIFALKKGKTMFTIRAFNGGVDFKLFIPMLIIGIVPFAMQIFRIYDIELLNQLIKELVDGLPAHELGQWSTFFTATSRPMMLIMMPGMAVLQAGSAFLAYNYGAGNRHRVNRGIAVMIFVMFVYATPSWIFLLAASRYVLVWFGVGGSYSAITHQMIFIQRVIVGLGILNCFVMAANAYVISTKRMKTGLFLQVLNLIVIYTIVSVLMFLTFNDTDQYMYFYLSNAIITAASAVASIIVLVITVIKDHNHLIRSGHVDAMHEKRTA